MAFQLRITLSPAMREMEEKLLFLDELWTDDFTLFFFVHVEVTAVILQVFKSLLWFFHLKQMQLLLWLFCQVKISPFNTQMMHIFKKKKKKIKRNIFVRVKQSSFFSSRALKQFSYSLDNRLLWFLPGLLFYRFFSSHSQIAVMDH